MIVGRRNKEISKKERQKISVLSSGPNTAVINTEEVSRIKKVPTRLKTSKEKEI